MTRETGCRSLSKLSLKTSYILSECLPLVKMVKHCSYGTCKSDSRYPEKLGGAKFIPFPKPKSDLQKCLRWIALCRRPHSHLYVEKITKHTYICSKHFISLSGPNEEYPDPNDALSGEFRKSRRHVSYAQNNTLSVSRNRQLKDGMLSMWSLWDTTEGRYRLFNGITAQSVNQSCSLFTISVYPELDVFSMVARIRQLEEENNKLIRDFAKRELLNINKCDKQCQTEEFKQRGGFEIEEVVESNIKNLFKFYTGLTYPDF
ncbi:uncharacterized protein LOC135467427 [Liolophura sinensis]|uniref:uncharacterized protein LOC135467427 n=1 Tax=Liolophura sinensis TaxID=3198878 RepID=UPI0031593B3A